MAASLFSDAVRLIIAIAAVIVSFAFMTGLLSFLL